MPLEAGVCKFAQTRQITRGDCPLLRGHVLIPRTTHRPYNERQPGTFYRPLAWEIR